LLEFDLGDKTSPVGARAVFMWVKTMIEDTKMPIGRMIAIFLATLLMGHAALLAIGIFAPDIEMPGSIGIVLLTVAAIAAGGAFAKATNRKMTNGEKLRFALLGTVTGLLLAFGVMAAILAYAGVPLSLEAMMAAIVGEFVSRSEIMSMLPILLGVATVTTMLVCFFGVGVGANAQLKQAAKLAAKGK
jgi:hypothetical protein